MVYRPGLHGQALISLPRPSGRQLTLPARGFESLSRKHEKPRKKRGVAAPFSTAESSRHRAIALNRLGLSAFFHRVGHHFVEHPHTHWRKHEFRQHGGDNR